jgi:tRNA(fMet)-specific endonuclease VapC
MRYLLDTNIVIAWRVRGNPQVVQMLGAHRADIALSVVVMHELIFGAYNSSRVAENLSEIDKIQLPVLPLSEEDARVAAEIRAVLRRSGTPIGPYDLLIAGQALARDMILVTNNVGEFGRVEGLRLEDWTSSIG